MNYNFLPKCKDEVILKDKAYNSIHSFLNKAFKQSDKELPRKDILVLFGPSGCGKTSAIRYLSSKECLNFEITDQNQLEQQQKEEHSYDENYTATEGKIFVKAINSAYNQSHIVKKRVYLMNYIPNIHKPFEISFVRKYFEEKMSYFRNCKKHKPKPIIFEINDINATNIRNCKLAFPEALQPYIEEVQCYGVGIKLMKNVLDKSVSNYTQNKKKKEFIIKELIQYIIIKNL